MNEICIEIVKGGLEGYSLLINKRLIAGPESWIGGTVIFSCIFWVEDIEKFLHDIKKP